MTLFDRPRNNRTSRVINGTPLTFTYDAANQLTAIGSTSLTYDRNGNLLTYGTNTAAYDASNRWTSGNWAGSALTFTYDGLGQQVSRTTAGALARRTVPTTAGQAAAVIALLSVIMAIIEAAIGMPHPFVFPGALAPWRSRCFQRSRCCLPRAA